MNEKYILGLNGWIDRGHDASAVIIRASKEKIDIIAAAEEERFSRIKHAYDTLPINSVEFCLGQAEIKPEDIDDIAFGWDIPLMYNLRGFEIPLDEKEIKHILFKDSKCSAPIHFINHHLSHALSAYAPSGFDNSLILVLDGQGECESATAWKAHKNNIRKISSNPIRASFGYFYEALSAFMGFKGGDQAGKAMGFSAFGRKNRFSDKLSKMFVDTGAGFDLPGFSEFKLGKKTGDYAPVDEQEQTVKYWLETFSRISGKYPVNHKPNSFKQLSEVYLDLAASCQSVLEEKICCQVNKMLPDVSNNLCMAGGVALNCSLNGSLYNMTNIFVQPAANDAGAALGSALEVARQHGYNITNTKMSPYLGKEYSDNEIREALNSENAQYYEGSIEEKLAESVAQGKVIGLFQGRFEFGPRALGNRSIIANPRDLRMGKYVNKYIKHREHGRPLAATIISDESQNIFAKKIISPYMTVSFPVKAGGLMAVTHVDSSTRPQILDKTDNPIYYQQIERIGSEIGCRAVLNTSLNNQEPIINTPMQALHLLKITALDGIAFNNNFMVYRK